VGVKRAEGQGRAGRAARAGDEAESWGGDAQVLPRPAPPPDFPRERGALNLPSCPRPRRHGAGAPPAGGPRGGGQQGNFQPAVSAAGDLASVLLLCPPAPRNRWGPEPEGSKGTAATGPGGAAGGRGERSPCLPVPDRPTREPQAPAAGEMSE
jgi:hypothetical protein